MELPKPRFDREKWEKLGELSKNGTPLIAGLALQSRHSFWSGVPQGGQLWTALTALYGRPPTEITAGEFYCPELREAFATLAGREIADKLPELIALRLEGQFSDSPDRRSYRSQNFAYYAQPVIVLLGQLIAQSCYPESIRDRLCSAPADRAGFAYLLALELRRGNGEIVELIRKAMMGDNSEIFLTWDIIDAVIISGHEGLLGELIRLLLSAGLQEGLRQQILEAADRGTADVLANILLTCLEHDLFRYSSAIRAFDVWSGMGYSDAKGDVVRRYARLAYDCLTDEGKRRAYYQSENNAEAYFALWAMGCREIQDTYMAVPQLLTDTRTYRRMLGWFFVNRTDSVPYKMRMAMAHLEERDENVLAWLVGCLAQPGDILLCGWRFEKENVGKTFPDAAYPGEPEARRKLFYRLEALAEYLGSGVRRVAGPFPFSDAVLDRDRVHGCMIGLAGYDMDPELVTELLAVMPNMSAEQRSAVISVFPDPDRHPAHLQYLLDALHDQWIRQVAVKRLEQCCLDAGAMELVADCLRTGSSSVRGMLMGVLRRQTPELLRPLAEKMLRAPEEFHNRAGIELLSVLKKTEPEIIAANRAALTALGEKSLSAQTRILLNGLLTDTKDEPAWSEENGYGLYDPAAVRDYLDAEDCFACNTAYQQEVLAEFSAMLPDWETLDSVAGRIDQVFRRHGDYEYEIALQDGTRKTVLFGDFNFRDMPLPH